MNILLFGPPGAGKGTQSARLVADRDMQHISTGDLFRNAIRLETPLGRKAKTFMDKGELVPDDVVIGMVEEVFISLEGRNFILDGFPRTVPQADALETLLERQRLEIGKALFLEVPEELLMERLTGRRVCTSCGAVYHVKYHPPKKEGLCDVCGNEVIQRNDDREGAIRKRLEIYKATTGPLKEFYRESGKLEEVNGTGEEHDVYKKLLLAMS